MNKCKVCGTNYDRQRVIEEQGHLPVHRGCCCMECACRAPKEKE